MLVSVATAIADIIDSKHLKYDYIIPKVGDPRIIHIVTDTLKNAIQRHIDKKGNNNNDNNYSISIQKL
jgi:malate dehydrogenase (oxaloacetate-decarboxylating)